MRTGEIEPGVTLIVSAFNEAAVIAEKIRNSLALDYPREKIEIVVISDASDDGTDEVVGQFAAQGVRLLRMNDRGGKTLGLNAGVRAAKGEIVVFSDANAMYLPDAIRKMTRNFADPQVGAVVGESTYADAEGGAQKSESLYWKYETGIKRLETQIGSTVGGDGAIYAIRRSLYRDMRADALSDFVNPMQIVMAGYRCIYEPQAQSVEEAAEGFDKEFRRKVRIVNRAWRATWTLPALLNPLRFGWFSLAAHLAQAAALAHAAVSRRCAAAQRAARRARAPVLVAPGPAARVLCARARGLPDPWTPDATAAHLRAVLLLPGQHSERPRHHRSLSRPDVHHLGDPARDIQTELANAS